MNKNKLMTTQERLHPQMEKKTDIDGLVAIEIWSSPEQFIFQQ